MLNIFLQTGLFVFGASAIFLLARKNKWGFVAGLISQPFWFATAIINNQWGLFFLNFVYLGSFAYGFYEWFLKDSKTKDKNNSEISLDDFKKIELRVGTIVEVSKFPEARKPAYKITVDFGDEIGRKKTSAQVTDLYSENELLGKQIIGVVNFPPKQIGPFISEFLLTGFVGEDGKVVLAVPDKKSENGRKLM